MKIIKVPFSAGSLGKNKGCELAPSEILKELKKKISKNILIDKIEVDNSNFDKSYNLIYSKSKLEENSLAPNNIVCVFPQFKPIGKTSTWLTIPSPLASA